LKPLGATLPSASSHERRDTGTRGALLHRIWDEFDEMPGTSLTLPQAARLFGLPVEVCDRILVSLVKDGRLRRTQDGRFRLRSFVA
jgi:DNA-binding IclR family transcriptional regulator